MKKGLVVILALFLVGTIGVFVDGQKEVAELRKKNLIILKLNEGRGGKIPFSRPKDQDEDRKKQGIHAEKQCFETSQFGTPPCNSHA